jgi:hypothetical protein
MCGGSGWRDRDGRDPVCPTCRGVGVVAADDVERY